MKKKYVAMKTTGSEKLRATVVLCITANDNKLPSYVIPVKQKDSAERKYLQTCNSSDPKKYMYDIGVNGRLASIYVNR
jgi:hypothetical protein